VSAAPPSVGSPPPTGAFRETNGLAIASLILGILAIVPVAIVLGIVALVQIGRRGDDGRGLAIAGIAISCAWVVIAVVAIVVLVDNIVGRDDVTYLSPDRFDWAIGDHDVICFANYASRRSGALDGV
jgi:hypothetical protein